MSVYKRASGRWAVRLDDSRHATGTRKRVSLGTFERKKDAEAAERAAKIRLERGESIAKSNLTLTGLFERFIADSKARGLSGTTIYGYERMWKYCTPIATISADMLRPADLSNLYAHLIARGGLAAKGRKPAGTPLSAKTVGNVHGMLSSMLGWATRLEMIQRDVSIKVEAPKVIQKKARPYDALTAQQLIEAAAKTRSGPIVIFGLCTALRRGELAGLRWSDIDLERRTATIRGSIAIIPKKRWYKETKANRVQMIALSEVAIAALKAQRLQNAEDRAAACGHYVDDGYVFAGELGGMPSPDTLARAVRKVAIDANLPLVGLHAMRHAVGTWLLHAGVDVRTVSAILRHADASITLRVYGHEVEGAQAAAVEHLDRLLKR